ncbi:hypothetical protein FA120_13300 [Pseudomonas aeruginosa]|nr:hypothetical protein [Pseudomonas aeruginosa]MCO3818124.1 hypothetical protein [Pseudomonas aeruginosa]RUF21516.1 hypothetical protein IPC1115_29065 [Pseudomonas aeruginosa]HBP5584194.1 hypothetical protein [Pseudomonas aeruginosa]
MSLQCPRCNSLNIVSLPPATKIRALVGVAGRAARGASAALAGTKPVLSMTLGVISEAILGSIDGRATGAHLNEQLNRHIANSHCLTCGHCFSLPT